MSREFGYDGFSLQEYPVVSAANRLAYASNEVLRHIEQHIGRPLGESLYVYSFGEDGKNKSLGSWKFLLPKWQEEDFKIMNVNVSGDIFSLFERGNRFATLGVSLYEMDSSNMYELLEPYTGWDRISDEEWDKEGGEQIIQTAQQRLGLSNLFVSFCGHIRGFSTLRYSIWQPYQVKYTTANYPFLRDTFDIRIDNAVSINSMIDPHSFENHLLTSLMENDISNLQLSAWILEGLIQAQQIEVDDDPWCVNEG